MKKITLLTLGLIASAASSVFAQNTDSFGYTFRSSTDTGANVPSFNWVDITGKGMLVTGLGDDNGTALLPMGFNFQYYFGSYSEVALGVNGWISFNKKTVLSPAFPIIPTPGGQANNFIAPFLSDLNFAGKDSITQEPNPGKMYYYSNNKDTFIVSYVNVPFWTDSNTRPNEFGLMRNSFQIILSAADSSITFNYLDIADLNESASGLQAGIENVSGQIGLSVFNVGTNDFTVPIGDSLTVKFYFPDSILAEVKDATVAWNQNPDNAGFFVSKNTTPVPLRANIANVGNLDVSNIRLSATIRKGTGGSSTNVGRDTLDVLAVGRDTTVQFNGFIPGKEGNFLFRVEFPAATDGFGGNNNAQSEVVVVDTTRKEVELTYAQMDQAGDGNFGFVNAAIYIEPPFYPAEIVGADFYVEIAGNTTDGAEMPASFRYEVVAADEEGNPDTVLYADSVAKSEYFNRQIASDEFTAPVKIEKGGFFLFFFPNDQVLQLKTDATPPASFRSYEVLGGITSPYRQGDVQDFQMGVRIKGSNTFVGVDSKTASAITMSQNYPNPSKNITTVEYTLSESANVEFVISNILGQEVESIKLDGKTSGKHLLNINVSKYNAGIYSYSMKVNGETAITKKMVVAK